MSQRSDLKELVVIMYFLYVYCNRIKRNQTVYYIILNKTAEYTGKLAKEKKKQT